MSRSAATARSSGLPLVLIATGLPQVPGLAGDAKSYAERLFEFPIVGALTAIEARDAWNHAAVSPITIDDVRDVRQIAIEKRDESFFRVRFNRMTDQEKLYLRAMAERGAGPHRTASIADELQRKQSDSGPVRDGLIKKGMVYSPKHGEVAFTVPLFDDFMRRAVSRDQYAELGRKRRVRRAGGRADGPA